MKRFAADAHDGHVWFQRWPRGQIGWLMLLMLASFVLGWGRVGLRVGL